MNFLYSRLILLDHTLSFNLPTAHSLNLFSHYLLPYVHLEVRRINTKKNELQPERADNPGADFALFQIIGFSAMCYLLLFNH